MGSWRTARGHTWCLVWYPGVAGISPLRIGRRVLRPNGGIGLNITKKELTQLRITKELEESFQVLAGNGGDRPDGYSDSDWNHYKTWRRAKGSRSGYRYNNNNVGTLTRIKGRIKMAWMASEFVTEGVEGKVLAQADTLDDLLEQLMAVDLHDDAEVTIMHV